MKKAGLMCWLSGAMAILGVLAFFPACEDTPDTDIPDIITDDPYSSVSREDVSSIALELLVDPTGGTVSSVGDKVPFAVYGGTGPYTWTVVNSGRGSIAVTTGSVNNENAAYTCSIVANNTVIVTDKAGKTGTASITAGGTTALAITPPTKAYAGAAPVACAFTAVGGIAPYSNWSVSRDDLVTSIVTGGANVQNATITVDAPVGGTNTTITVYVRDDAGSTATATITCTP